MTVAGTTIVGRVVQESNTRYPIRGLVCAVSYDQQTQGFRLLVIDQEGEIHDVEATMCSVIEGAIA